MPETYVTDMRHYLDDAGELPDLPAPALALALFQGAIVEWVTIWELMPPRPTNVLCRRAGRARSPCRIDAAYEEAGAAILWRCPCCGDGGRISGWEGTLWDRRGEAFDHDAAAEA